jgi:hypothetical protein
MLRPEVLRSWLSSCCLEMRLLRLVFGIRLGGAGMVPFPASLNPHEKLFTFQKPYKPLVRNQAEQAALTQHEGLLPPWPSALPSPSCSPFTRGFFRGLR